MHRAIIQLQVKPMKWNESIFIDGTIHFCVLLKRWEYIVWGEYKDPTAINISDEYEPSTKIVCCHCIDLMIVKPGKGELNCLHRHPLRYPLRTHFVVHFLYYIELFNKVWCGHLGQVRSVVRILGNYDIMTGYPIVWQCHQLIGLSRIFCSMCDKSNGS